MDDRDRDRDRINPNIVILSPFRHDCEREIPTRHNRKMLRGDTLYFLDQVFRDIASARLFTIPTSVPCPKNPRGALPFDLTGSEVWFTAKSAVPDPDQAAIISLNNMSLGGVVLVTPTTGVFSVTGAPSLTQPFPDSEVRIFFDIQVKDTTGRVSTVEIGHYEVDPDITRMIV